jgi:hypothetical protein
VLCRLFDLETSRIGAPYVYDISNLRVNNSDTNEDIATKFEQEYVRCVRNEEECVRSVCLFRCNFFIAVKIIKEMPGSVATATSCINNIIGVKLFGADCIQYIKTKNSDVGNLITIQGKQGLFKKKTYTYPLYSYKK